MSTITITLQNIRDKVRQLTGRKSVVQLSDAQLDFQINSFYNFRFPMAFRTLDLRTEYNFTTNPNVDVYDLPQNTFQSFEPTAYIEGYPTIFVEDRSMFHNLFPDIRNDVLLTLGTGAVTSHTYTGFITGVPILKKSVLVYAATSFSTSVSLVDDGAINNTGLGNLVVLNADGTLGAATPNNTINYQTGEVHVTFSQIIPQGNEIRVQSKQYAANRPTTVFYFANGLDSSNNSVPQLTLRPVPDKCYNVRLIAYQLPSQFMNSASQPSVAEWWQAIAYGASMQIFENLKDLDSASQMADLMEREFVWLGRREWFYLRSQRTSTIYNTPVIGSNPGYFQGFTGSWW